MICFMRNIQRTLAAIGIFLIFGASVYAETPNDREALAGLKEVKAVFEVVEGDGYGLVKQLAFIDDARASLIKQGVKPQIVLLFRGGATKLVQTDLSRMSPKDREYAPKIASKIDELRHAEGVNSLELCGTSIREQGTKAENVLPGVKVVGASWISLMAYQTKGYAYIAP